MENLEVQFQMWTSLLETASHEIHEKKTLYSHLQHPKKNSHDCHCHIYQAYFLLILCPLQTMLLSLNQTVMVVALQTSCYTHQVCCVASLDAAAAPFPISRTSPSHLLLLLISLDPKTNSLHLQELVIDKAAHSAL
jgi:hypothetical protein